MQRKTFTHSLRPVALAVLLGMAGGMAHADEREDLERLRQTTLNLINALVENGVLTREKANELIRDAEEKAAFQVALAREKAGEPPKAAPVAAAPAAPVPVRVQYIPESVKKEIRDQIRKEVLSQAREEHWADPNAIPSWLDRIKLGGDILTRYQFDNYAGNNTRTRDYVTPSVSGATTRNGTFANTGDTAGNTTNDQSQLRLRVRLAADIKLSKDTTAGLRIASGSSNSRVSTTQTLGSDFNKYSLWLDRGFIKHYLTDWTSLQAGRMPNPFASSDLVWDDNVSFDGLAVGLRNRNADGFVPFATAGVFPLASENEPKASFSRTLLGAQVGAATDLSAKTRAQAGLAYYRYRNLAGKPETDAAFIGSANTYANTEYSASQRQKGNTLVRLNAPSDSSTTAIWGLASKFSPLHFGSSFDYARSDALHFVLSADYVKNMAFDRNEIEARTGVRLSDGSSTGYQMRFVAGTPAVRKKDQWNASLTFRRLGSDAVPDAFADGSLGGGGTNVRGYILGFNYGVDVGTVLGFKYLSGRSIDSPTTLDSSHQFRLNTYQVDLGVGF